MPKPEPVATNVICSLCGLDWGKHGDKPTTTECIRLLKAELASRPVWRSGYLPGNTHDIFLDTTTIAPSNYTSNFTLRTPNDDDGPDAVPAVA